LMVAKALHVQPVSQGRIVGPPTQPSPQGRAVGPPTARESYTGRDKFPSQHPWFGYK
jgi:hypothetical protein